MALVKSIMGIMHCPQLETIILTNGFKTSSAAYLDTVWRKKKGLCQNPNNFGPLVNLPDYSFKDGRPVPYGVKQRARILKNREYAAKIVKYVKEMDFAVERHERIKREQEEERQRILKNKLKPKGALLLQQNNDS